MNSLSGWKGLKKFIPRDSLNSSLIYILFSMVWGLHRVFRGHRDHRVQIVHIFQRVHSTPSTQSPYCAQDE